MTTINPYTSLTNQEFLRLHGDRIPEDLLPRIEEVFESYVGRDEVEDIDHLQRKCENLEYENSNLEDKIYDLHNRVNELERKLEALEAT